MTRLKRQYLTYNRKYFASRLPLDTIVKWKNLGMNMLGCSIDAGSGIIYVSKDLMAFGTVWKMTLLHEMAHLSTASEVAAHGPRWIKEMRRLARIGAFDKLW